MSKRYGAKNKLKIYSFKFKGIFSHEMSERVSRFRNVVSKSEAVREVKKLKRKEEFNLIDPDILKLYFIADLKYFDLLEGDPIGNKNFILVGVIGDSGYYISKSENVLLVE